MADNRAIEGTGDDQLRPMDEQGGDLPLGDVFRDNPKNDRERDMMYLEGSVPRRVRKLAKLIVEKHWRARWHFDKTGLTVIYPDGLILRFEI